ncbi:protein-S-isoprenylcysteine O-methyltransferase Ste14 [Neisseria sp. HSC-16F19]|nr:isoprenylcysteine carboxylmethyltransferase family protein [Neisseria sp. HSC-16F19]MCP2040993.1 protein-S-isoprenylcysteine O-methyltransferase Ste14 [Neisseria sp. HSC-16F19]
MSLKLPPPVVMLACALLMWAATGLPESRDSGWHWLSLLPFGAALAIMFTAVRQFRRYQTTVNPFTPDKSSRLVQDGVFRYSRNPMYLGMALLLAAWAWWLAQPCAVLGVALFVLWIQTFQINTEERALTALFGDEYHAYCRRTRRWL